MPAHLSPALFRFLTELAAHNERPWFEANKGRYLREVRDPVLRLIGELQAPLARVSKHFDVDPRPVGGSMSRIYRDIRFSADKSPYKTAVTVELAHRDGGDAAMLGFYLRLAPGSSILGGGVWQPAPDALRRIREAIIEDPKGWQAASALKALGPKLHGAKLHGEKLKRAPRGFDEQHPCIEDLKRKSFALGFSLSDRALVGPKALSTVVGGYRRIAPFMRFLCKALGLPF
jgi:uncharacterized protein (TIGR02453 family)